MKEMWNTRFANNEFIYGKEPNLFFRNEIEKLSPGKLLLPGEGEGRNGVFAAKLGWAVDAIDWSDSAKNKAEFLAEENKVKINYIINDLSVHNPKANYYDAVGLIFLHMHPELREDIHRKVVNSLKCGGVVVLESYEKEQINNSSGGPKDLDLLYSLEEIFTDFSDLNIISFSKETIELNESPHHQGRAEVIRYVGLKA